MQKCNAIRKRKDQENMGKGKRGCVKRKEHMQEEMSKSTN